MSPKTLNPPLEILANKFMDFDTTARSLMFFVALPAAAKGLYEISIGTRGTLREEYKFARDFLTDLERIPPVHPYAIEKGYQALVGDSALRIDEVEYLLSLKDSPRALRDYVLGRSYLEHLQEAGNLQIAFTSRYRSRWSRLWRRTVYSVLGMLFWVLAFGPLVFAHELSPHLPKGAPLQLAFLCVAVFLPNAFFSIKAWARIYRAEKLVEHQEKHTQRIFIHTSVRKQR